MYRQFLAKLYCTLIVPTNYLFVSVISITISQNSVMKSFSSQLPGESNTIEEFTVKFLSWMLSKYLSSKCTSLFCERRVPRAKQVIALDTEMVGAGDRGSISMLARVSLVFQNGYVYDKYVKPTKPVMDYRTPWSGIHEEDLRKAEDYQTIQQEVAHIIQDCILVGHDLKNDLNILLLTHPSKDIRDTAYYMPLRKMVALKHIETQRNITRNNMTHFDPLLAMCSEVQAQSTVIIFVYEVLAKVKCMILSFVTDIELVRCWTVSIKLFVTSEAPNI